jgi:3-carboxy-cis,cis-muconate cycloisomerase
MARETKKTSAAAFRRGPRRAQGNGQLIDLLSNDPEIAKFLDHTAIERLIEPTNYLGNSGAMVDRVLAGRGE